MALATRLRRAPRLLLGPGLVVAALWSLAAAAAERLPSAVVDLRYGAALYRYYQQDYLSALSELQVAQARGGIHGHGDHPLMLEGAMQLAFGMSASAQRSFARVLADADTTATRNAAWFYLTRLHLRGADWLGARRSLRRIDEEVDPALADEVRAMQVDLALHFDRLEAAAALVARQTDSRAGRDSDWLPYMLYNLAVACLRTGELERGVAYLDQLAALSLRTAEHWALQDKALTAAGFALLRQGRYEQAGARFTQVRQHSPLVARALLGYGWSLLERGDVAQALGPWQTLANRPVQLPAAREARLAVPHAHEQLGYLNAALRDYGRAESAFGAEIARLAALKGSLQPTVLLAALAETEAAALDSSVVQATEAGARTVPTLDGQWLGLVELLSADRFEAYRRASADLQVLEQRLRHWQQTVAVYQAMLVERRARRARILVQLRERAYPDRLERLAAARDRLAAALARPRDADELSVVLADAATLALWRRVERVDGALQRLAQAGEAVAEERMQLRRYRGLVLWQASERRSAWQWQARKRLRQLDQALEAAQASQRRLARVVAAAPDIAPFERRLTVLERRVRQQSAAVASSREATEQALRALVVGELAHQQASLRDFQAQARLARARLYDRAQLEAAR